MQNLLVGFIALLLLSVTSINAVAGEEVYQAPETFIMESFGGVSPPIKKLDASENAQEKITKIMGKHYKLPHVQYWIKDGRTAWVLEEIGKFETRIIR